MKKIFEVVTEKNESGRDVKRILCNFNLVNENYQRETISTINVDAAIIGLKQFANEIGEEYIAEFIHKIRINENRSISKAFKIVSEDMNLDETIYTSIKDNPYISDNDLKINKIMRKMILAKIVNHSGTSLKKMIVEEIEKEFDMDCISFFKDIVKVNSTIDTLNTYTEVLVINLFKLQTEISFIKYLKVSIKSVIDFRCRTKMHTFKERTLQLKYHPEHTIDYMFGNSRGVINLCLRNNKTKGLLDDLEQLRTDIRNNIENHEDSKAVAQLFFKMYKESKLYEYFKVHLSSRVDIAIETVRQSAYIFDNYADCNIREEIVYNVLPGMLNMTNEEAIRLYIDSDIDFKENEETVKVLTRQMLLGRKWIMRYYINNNLK